MPARKPLTDAEGEVRELTAEDIKQFKPAAEVLPAELYAGLVTAAKRRGRQNAPTKERITIRLSREVLERFRATGEGWQTRIDEALKQWLREHPG